jgi:hypothetical protein
MSKEGTVFRKPIRKQLIDYTLRGLRSIGRPKLRRKRQPIQCKDGTDCRVQTLTLLLMKIMLTAECEAHGVIRSQTYLPGSQPIGSRYDVLWPVYVDGKSTNSLEVNNQVDVGQ